MLETAANSKVAGLSCLRCGAQYPADLKIDSRGCPSCRDVAPVNLEVLYAPEMLRRRQKPELNGENGFACFADYLPVGAEEMISLGEGNTLCLVRERSDEL